MVSGGRAVRSAVADRVERALDGAGAAAVLGFEGYGMLEIALTAFCIP
jgi:hypothetical protein